MLNRLLRIGLFVASSLALSACGGEGSSLMFYSLKRVPNGLTTTILFPGQERLSCERDATAYIEFSCSLDAPPVIIARSLDALRKEVPFVAQDEGTKIDFSVQMAVIWPMPQSTGYKAYVEGVERVGDVVLIRLVKCHLPDPMAFVVAARYGISLPILDASIAVSVRDVYDTSFGNATFNGIATMSCLSEVNARG